MRSRKSTPGAAAPTAMESLAALALDLRNCWDHTTDPVWSTIDPELWALTHNPWVVLQTASRTKLKTLEKDAKFVAQVRELLERQRQSLTSDAWFHEAHRDAPLGCV